MMPEHEGIEGTYVLNVLGDAQHDVMTMNAAMDRIQTGRHKEVLLSLLAAFLHQRSDVTSAFLNFVETGDVGDLAGVST